MKEKISIILLAHRWDYLTIRPYYSGLYFSKLGYNVHLILPSEKFFFRYKTKEINSHFQIYFCPTIFWRKFKKGCDPIDLIVRFFILMKLKYDIIIACDSRPTVILPAVFFKFFRKVPLIIEWTDWFGRGGTISERSSKLYKILFNRFETFFEEYFRNFADSATVICRPLEKRLRGLNFNKNILYFPLPCYYIPEMKGSITKLRSKLNLPLGKKLIGCVGTLFKSDANMLINSYDLIKGKMNVAMILIGKNNLIDAYKIPEDVYVTGSISYDKLLEYIYCCDIMVMPLKNNIANNGRWPSKLNDYLIMGKPVISTGISVMKELIKEYAFGEISDDNPKDFSNTILHILSNKYLMKEYGRNALNLARNKLNYLTVMKEMHQFLIQTINEYFYPKQNKSDLIK